MMSILPLYNVLALPGARMWLRKKDYALLTGKEPVQEERVTLLMQREDEDRSELSPGSFYPIAVTGIITEVDGNGFLTIALQNRVDVTDVVQLLSHRGGRTGDGN